MTVREDGTDRDGDTRIGEWADLVGDEVPDRARRERVLGPDRGDDADGGSDPEDPWRAGAS